jgi:hypothetical protein
MRLQNNVATDLVDLFISPTTAQRRDQFQAANEGFSSDRENFIAHEMQADTCGLRAVEVERLHSFLVVGPQLLPGVALSKDALRQTLGTVTAVRFLGDLEHDFVHIFDSKRYTGTEQAAIPVVRSFSGVMRLRI